MATELDFLNGRKNGEPFRPVGLVTGASRGLGEFLASFLASQGYDLILTARGSPALEATARRLALNGGNVQAIPGDVAIPAHRQRLIEAAGERGRLNLLINNASSLGTSPLPALSVVPLNALQEVMAVNLFAPLGLIQLALPLLQESGGLVVNISSDAALGGYPGWGGYGASKAALDLVSKTLASELTGTNVAVVSVDPGDLQTDMHQRAYPGEDISDRPLPEQTLPFWAWLLGQDREEINGGRFQAQSERWEIPA